MKKDTKDERSESLLYTTEKAKVHNHFFNEIIKEFNIKKSNSDIVAVLHILPDAIPFIGAITKIANIKLITVYLYGNN